jgi:hypothetical protein
MTSRKHWEGSERLVQLYVCVCVCVCVYVHIYIYICLLPFVLTKGCHCDISMQAYVLGANLLQYSLSLPNSFIFS